MQTLRNQFAFGYLRRGAAMLAFALGMFTVIGAATAATTVNTTFGGTAIKGYDPVAYFTQNHAVKGSKEFTLDWMDATWRFASAAHRDAFAADPERYAPQYRGYCAFAVSQGTTANIDPQAWRVVDGKLYLNLSKDIQELWLSDVSGYINKADANWPQISSDLSS